MLCSVYISIGDAAPVNSCLCCIPVSTVFSSRFLGSGASSCALPRCAGLLWEFLYKRKAMKDRRATSRVPNEMPTPIPILADSPRPAADADGDVKAGVEAGVEADVEMVVRRTVTGGMEDLEEPVGGAEEAIGVERTVGEPVTGEIKELGESVGGAEEAVEVPVARMLLTTLTGIRACPSAANSPRCSSQHVVFTASLARGQNVPSEQLFSCWDSVLISKRIWCFSY